MLMFYLEWPHPSTGTRGFWWECLPGHCWSPAWTSKIRHRQVSECSTSLCYWMSIPRCSCKTKLTSLEKEALRIQNKSVVPPQTPALHHCGILSTCGFQPFSHCTSLKIWLHVSWLSGNLIFLICSCKSLWKFPWIAWDSMDLWFEHPSTASILCIRLIYL